MAHQAGPRTSTESLGARPRPVDPASLLDAGRYGSPLILRNLLLAGFAVYSLIMIFAMSWSFRRMTLVQDFLTRVANQDGIAQTFVDDVAAADAGVALGALLMVVAFLGVGVLFIAWFRRMYHNVPALGLPNLKHKLGWAVGGWFVPLLNLVRPVQIANDIWRGSDPDRPPERGTAWWSASAPPLLAVWWGALIVSSVMGRFASSVDLETPEDFVTLDRLNLLASLVQLATVPLAIAVVYLTTKRQQARADRWLPLAVEPVPPPLPPIPRGFT